MSTTRHRGFEPRSADGLLGRSVTALKWNYAGVAVTSFSQLAVGIILARLLGPEPFGVVAVAWTVIGVCNIFLDFGFVAALVQRDRIYEKDMKFAFMWQVALGLMLSTVGIAVAGVVASFFHRPDAANPLRAMFLLFVIQSFGQTSQALLRRSLEFRVIQQISIASYLVGYLAVGVSCASLGLGVWALVFASLSQALLSTAGLIAYGHAPMKFALRPQSPGLFMFGGKVIAANITSWASSNLDNVVIGRTLGVVQLGLYNRAFTLVASPMNAFVSGLQGVLFSALSHVGNERDRLWRAYIGATSAVALVCFPVFFSIAVSADAIVLGLYGDKWIAAVPALRPLALAVAVTAVLALAGPLLMSIDRVVEELRAQIVVLAVMLPMLAAAARYSLAVVAWAMLAVALLRWYLLTRAVIKELGGNWRDVASALQFPFAIAGSVAASQWMVNAMTEGLRNAAPLRLGILASSGAAATIVALRIFGSRLLEGELGNIFRSRGPLPTPLSYLLKVES